MSSDFTFPSPVGGVPFSHDYAPSILFAVLYGLLVPVVFWRFWFVRSRTIAVIGTFAFAVERVVIFSLRAEQSQNRQKRDSNGLAIYMQTTFAVGYVSIAADLVMLMRSLLRSATSAPGSNAQYHTVRLADPEASQTFHSLIPEVPEGDRDSTTVPAHYAGKSEDRTKETWWYRRIGGAMLILGWLSLILGTVYGLLYPKAETDSGKAELVQQLRYASAGVICIVLTGLQVFSVYCALTVRNIHRYHTYLITGLATLMNIITVYRLVVMNNQTTAIDSLAPGSLNSPAAKAAFYVLHVVPEWLTAAILLGINVRKRFDTGLWGEHWPSKNKASTKA